MIKRIALVLVCLVLFQPIRAAETLQWSALPDLPVPLQEIYPTVHENRLVVAGGLNVSEGKLAASDRVFAYSSGDESWQELPSLPAKRHHGYLVSFDNQLLLIGGFLQTEQGDWVGTPSVLTLDNDKWIAHSLLNNPQAETNVAVLKGKLHMVGGRVPKGASNMNWRDHADTSQHWIWYPDIQLWRAAKPMPSKRNSSCSVVIGSDWYVIGGRTVNSGNTAANEKYNADTERWSMLAPMPQAQGGHACAVMQGDIYVMGGEFFDNGGGVYDEVWVYDPDSDSWSQQGNVPVPRHGLGAVQWQDSIVLIGGAEQVGAKGTLSSVVRMQH